MFAKAEKNFITLLYRGSVIFRLQIACCTRPLADFGSFMKDNLPQGS